jgi:aspartate/methionine/tyrosine aminotransferase
MNPQANELNAIIKQHNEVVYGLLSDKGKNIFFPKQGILAQTAEAKGKNINATIGAAIEADGSPMRLKTLEDLINIPAEYAFPYAPSYGRLNLRQHWKQAIYDKNPALNNHPLSLPVTTNALTHALSLAGYLFINEGDKVIVSDLFWENYNLIFKNAYNATFDTFGLFDNTSFNLSSFKEKMMNSSIAKKILILNFPNNPTGYTPTTEEVKQIVETIKASADAGNKILAIIDDAYFGLVYEQGIETQSVFAYLANLHENVLAVKIDGPTKEDYVWGFRTGFITYGIKNGTEELYNALESKTAGAVRGNISNASNLSQSLLLKAYQSDTYQQEKEEKFELLNARYQAVKKAVNHPKYTECFTPLPFNSGYFMCIKLKDGIDGERLRSLLLEKYDTGVINLNNVIRLAFSSVAEESIPELFENIYKACREIT